ncbi:MAG: LysM peptidoglycan-binding domain-containing protein [Clostridiales bacterium]|nr:LysM peptidoglycan-binding domain-containing protein [Clostridiales bacterium]
MYTADMMARTEIRRVRRAKALRQQKARRKLFLIFFLTIVVMFGIGVGFGTLLTRAEEPEKEPAYKYYTDIEIQKGDTLWDVAEAYMDSSYYMEKSDYINEVMSINRMVTDQLTTGQKLIVPYYSTQVK